MLFPLAVEMTITSFFLTRRELPPTRVNTARHIIIMRTEVTMLLFQLRMRLFSALPPLLVAIIHATEPSRRLQNCPAFAVPRRTTAQPIPAASRPSPPQQNRSNTSPTISTTDMSSTDPSTSSENPTDGNTTQDTIANDLVKQSIERLRERGIKVVIFDMDLTIVNQHSRGSLRRGDPLEAFLARVSPDFVKLAPALHKEGFHLAVATHSDEAEYGRRITPDTHILGDGLANTVLQRHLPPEVAESFFIVAYNPYARNNPFVTYFGDWAKRHHMKLIQNHYKVQSQEMLLFDDTKPIVMDCIRKCGVQAVQVSPLVGFRMSDILDKL